MEEIAESGQRRGELAVGLGGKPVVAVQILLHPLDLRIGGQVDAVAGCALLTLMVAQLSQGGQDAAG
ncbi:hypothetical protein ABGB08_26715 [Acrocarpospora sp. B8E8]